MKKRYWCLGITIVIITVFYLYPNPKKTFGELYNGDVQMVKSLETFRKIPLSSIMVNEVTWNYLSTGKGKETILFLHGMGGAYDIWFQQINALKNDYRIISPTYPAVNSVAEMVYAISKILEKEKIKKVYIVGSSLGGFVAQHFTATYPEKVERVVIGNTFPPNDIFKKENEGKMKVASYLPEWLLMKMFRKNLLEVVIPASGNSELTKAYLLEQDFGLMSKQQFLARGNCVMDKFEAPDFKTLRIPVMIIDADNDPLINVAMREKLKETYPTAGTHTFLQKGHFPYLNAPKEYTMYIKDFLNDDGGTKNDISTTINQYFKGRKEGNTALLKKIFHPTARLLTIKEDTLSSLSLSDYLNHVQAQGAVACKTTLLSTEVTGNIATAKTEFDYGTIKYIDYLSLLKVENEWRIVNKTYQKID